MAEYAYVWEFLVTAAHQQEFERRYGADGEWVALFRQHAGYIDTRLFQDRADPLRYVTIDRWDDIEAYRAFRVESAALYEALDAACAGLTVDEVSLGQLA